MSQKKSIIVLVIVCLIALTGGLVSCKRSNGIEAVVR
jgi:hypothetical protein